LTCQTQTPVLNYRCGCLNNNTITMLSFKTTYFNDENLTDITLSFYANVYVYEHPHI